MLSETPTNDYQEKKLRGSGGYVLAKITEEEQKRGNLGGPELFLAGVGRLDEKRLSKHYCNKCEKQFDGPPSIVYDNPNEDLGEGVILEEKGEYKCNKCNNTIAQYRKFRSPQNEKSVQNDLPSLNHQAGLGQHISSTVQQSSSRASEHSTVDSMHVLHDALANGKFLPIHSLIEMPAYDSEAMLIGNIKEIGLRRLENGRVDVSILVDNKLKRDEYKSSEILWSKISKIGDIVLINESWSNVEINSQKGSAALAKCKACGYANEEGSKYCEECGSKL
jgi:sporulation protein YlmC with PRC-barrel domain